MDTDAITQARALLPAWVGWTPLLVLPLLCLLVSWLATLAGAWVASRGQSFTNEAHWTERARVVYPVRVHAALSAFVVPGVLAFALAVSLGPLARVPAAWIASVCALSALLPVLWARYTVEKRLRPHVTGLGVFLRSGCTTVLVMIPHLGVVVAMLLLLPTELNTTAIVTLLLGGMLFAFTAAGGGLLVARAFGLVRPAPVRVQRIVDQAASRVGVRPRAVYEARAASANAFALPVPKLVLVTERLSGLLSDDELSAVVGHELGHLAEPRRVTIARMTPLAGLLLLAATKPLTSVGGLGVYFGALLVFLISIVMVRRMARRLEQKADGVAWAHQAEAGVYARALESIYRDNAMPAALRGARSTHDHLYDRLLQAGVAPAYPRPAPPSRWRAPVALLVSVAVVVACWGAVVAAERWQVARAGHAEGPLLAAMAIRGGSADALSALAALRHTRGDREAAEVLYGAACDADPGALHHAAKHAVVLGELGHCDASREAAELAQANLPERAERDEVESLRMAWFAMWTCRSRAGLGELPTEARE